MEAFSSLCAVTFLGFAVIGRPTIACEGNARYYKHNRVEWPLRSCASETEAIFNS
jgi:hypothetical protein